MITSKMTKKRGVDQTSTWHNFWSNKAFLMIFYAKWSWNIILLKKQHRGTQKSSKSNKNNTFGKIPIFGKIPKIRFFSLKIEKSWVKVGKTFWKEFQYHCIHGRCYSAEIQPKIRYFDIYMWEKIFFEVKKSKKIDFFKIGLNHIYMCIVHQKHV